MNMKILYLFLSLSFVVFSLGACSQHKEALQKLPKELALADECKNTNKSFELDCYDLISYKNTFAQLRLGIQAQRKNDYKEAYERYMLAKNRGNFYANALLADIYKKSKDIKKDEDFVLDLLRDVQDVDPIAAYKVAFFYMEKEDYDKAIELLEFAGKNGVKKAQYELYKIYSNGEKVKLNIEKSQYWFNEYENNQDDFIYKIYGL